MEKKYCETHHLYYSGDICPFCQSENYERMSRLHNHKYKKQEKPKKEESSEPVEITDDVINKLRNHFKK
jgi:SpoVK/Ycf46/Vps4 family AAA+-type ATPase